MTAKKTWFRLLTFVSALLLSGAVQAQLYNPNASAAQNKATLQKFLGDVYGKKIISGQMNDKYLSYIVETTGGKSPAMMGYDFNGICPSQGGNKDAEKAINWVKNKGGIAQFQWHWISPNADGDFYSSNFKLGAALNDTTSTSYKNMIRDIDLVAGEMKKMKDAGVPILWRPLHEAEGKWFWWGMSGGDACKKLYRLIYDRMVNKFKLDNLIWVWTSYGKTKENWYPGDDVVDMIVWDYPDYNPSGGSWAQYQQLFGGKGKLFGIGEDGKLTDPAVLATQGWLYFMTWSYMVEDPSVKDGKNPKDWLKQVYNDSRVITLDDLTPGPKASAGQSQLIFDTDGNGTENVQLDGSASKTDEGTITSYVWSENGTEIARGVTPTISLPVGIHTIQLTITTSANLTKSALVVVSIKTPSISLKKEYKVSSTEANLGNIASNAIDGNVSTRWSSTYSDPQWYQIDLGKSYNIKQVVISWEAASAKNYTVEVSDDGVSWQIIAAKSNMPAGARTDDLKDLSGLGRYVRMHGTERTSTWGYSIFEFEVFGTASSITGNKNMDLNKIRLYPTIIRNSQQMQVSCPNSLLPADYQICSQTGQIMKAGILTEPISFIDIERSDSGFYYFKLQHNNLAKAVKFIVVL
ncbi:MAG: discoidin domain-containing protein [Prolixibacteraceae bacterium]|nr:discoidin domain-containing protein [Prolixibacteraceae bacterium]